MGIVQGARSGEVVVVDSKGDECLAHGLPADKVRHVQRQSGALVGTVIYMCGGTGGPDPYFSGYFQTL